jgi:hypothetical protein
VNRGSPRLQPNPVGHLSIGWWGSGQWGDGAKLLRAPHVAEHPRRHSHIILHGYLMHVTVVTAVVECAWHTVTALQACAVLLHWPQCFLQLSCLSFLWWF